MFAVCYKDYKRDTHVVVIEANSKGEARQKIKQYADVKTLGTVIELKSDKW